MKSDDLKSKHLMSKEFTNIQQWIYGVFSATSFGLLYSISDIEHNVLSILLGCLLSISLVLNSFIVFLIVMNKDTRCGREFIQYVNGSKYKWIFGVAVWSFILSVLLSVSIKSYVFALIIFISSCVVGFVYKKSCEDYYVKEPEKELEELKKELEES